MEVNITLIVALILMIISGIKGYKTGLVKGISNLVALVVTVITLALILVITHGYREGAGASTLFSCICLVILGSVYGVVRFVLRSARAVSKLPFIRFINSVLGIAMGAACCLIILEGIITLAYAGMIPFLSEWIMEDVVNSKILTIISMYNPFI